MICTKCKKTVRVISKFLDDQLTNALEIAHTITNEVAKVIDNPLFQLLVSQLPANWNTPKILAVIEKVLQTANKTELCENLTGIERINCLMNALNLLPKDQRNATLLLLKSALTAEIDGNRYQKFVYDTAGQLDYFKVKIEAGAPVKIDSDFVAIEKDPATEKNLQPINVVQIAEQVLQPQATHALPIAETPQAAAPTPRAF